jgi:hypothetical protein
MVLDPATLYAAPKAVEPSATAAPEITAARVAGALIASSGLGVAAVTLFSIVTRGRTASTWPVSTLVGALVPSAVLAGVAVLLAIPLLKGSRRFRVLVLIRALLAVLFSLAFAHMARSIRAAEGLSLKWTEQLVEDLLFCTALFVLLVGRPGRARLAVGSALALIDLLWWLALQLGLIPS